MKAAVAAPNPAVVVVGLGLRTPIGLDTRMNAGAHAAGLNRFREVAYMRDRHYGDAVVMSLLTCLPNADFAGARMRAMALAAATEALRLGAENQAWLAQIRIPVCLALPRPRPGFTEEEARRLADDIISDLPVAVDPERCLALMTGAEGVPALLAYATDYLLNEGVPAVLVGGVDSYKDIDTVQWLDATERLKRKGRPYGLIPGEGAGFLLLCRATTAARQALSPLARLDGTGRATEPNPWYSGAPSCAKGLTDAFHQTFADRDPQQTAVTAVWSDLNGESWRAEEWSLAYLRTTPYQPEPLNHIHPADCWGDLGAASGAALAVLAAYHLSRDANPYAGALVWTASGDLPCRAACLLRHPTTAAIQEPAS